MSFIYASTSIPQIKMENKAKKVYIRIKKIESNGNCKKRKS